MDGEAFARQPGTDLIVAETLSPAAVFAPGAVETILQDIERRARADAESLDVSRPKDRAAIRSLAHKVARSKTALDEMGKALSDEHRRKADAVYAERRIVRERLDALQGEIRAPVEEFEARDKRRMEAHEAAIASLTSLLLFPAGEPSVSLLDERLELLGINFNRQWDEFERRATRTEAEVRAELTRKRAEVVAAEERRQEIERKRAEEEARRREQEARERQEREARIAAEAAEKARLDAEARAFEAAARERQRVEAEREAERLAAEARARDEEAERKRRWDRIEQQRLAAERQAEESLRAAQEAHKQAEALRAQAAIEQAEAAERERRAAEHARAEERQHQAAEVARMRAEAEAREANRAHRAKVNRAAVAGLIMACALTEDQAKAVIEAIARGQVAHISVQY